MNLNALIEGRCPTCDAALERRERDGWCTSCGVGYGIEMQGGTGTVTITLGPRIPPIFQTNKEPQPHE